MGLSILLVTLFAGTPSQTASKPADWECASPLIEKNYREPYDAKDLGKRIADECARPYIASIAEGSQGYDMLDQIARTTYSVELRTFADQITTEIIKARRKDRIVLKR